MDTEIRDLAREEYSITHCPVFIAAAEDVVTCEAPLVPVVTRTIRGDDLGEWPEYHIAFPCGHTFTDMAVSYRHGEYL